MSLKLVESKAFRVSKLLSLALLPDRFYAMVNDLSGRDAIYQNPGVSLRSFVVAKCLRYETVQIDGEMLDIVKDCEKFSFSPATLSRIVELLILHSSDLMSRATQMQPAVQVALVKHFTSVQEACKAVQISFESFILHQDSSKEYVDLETIPGVTFKEGLFTLQDLLFEIEEMIIVSDQAPESA